MEQSAGAWNIVTNEQPFVHQALDQLNIAVTTQALLADFGGQQVTLHNIFTNKPTTIPARSVVLVGLRLPNDDLYQQLES